MFALQDWVDNSSDMREIGNEVVWLNILKSHLLPTLIHTMNNSLIDQDHHQTITHIHIDTSQARDGLNIEQILPSSLVQIPSLLSLECITAEEYGITHSKSAYGTLKAMMPKLVHLTIKEYQPVPNTSGMSFLQAMKDIANQESVVEASNLVSMVLEIQKCPMRLLHSFFARFSFPSLKKLSIIGFEEMDSEEGLVGTILSSLQVKCPRLTSLSFLDMLCWNASWIDCLPKLSLESLHFKVLDEEPLQITRLLQQYPTLKVLKLTGSDAFLEFEQVESFLAQVEILEISSDFHECIPFSMCPQLHTFIFKSESTLDWSFMLSELNENCNALKTLEIEFSSLEQYHAFLDSLSNLSSFVHLNSLVLSTSSRIQLPDPRLFEWLKKQSSLHHVSV